MTDLTDPLHTDLVAALEAHADPVRAEGARRYFKEPIQTRGVAAAQVHAAGRAIAQRLKREGTLDDALELSERMLASGWIDEGCAVEDIMRPFRRQLTPAHFATLDLWVDYFSNWAVTDSVSCHVTGYLVERHPDLAARLVPWATAGSRWRRRAACVTLVVPVRHGALTPICVFAVTDPLMADRDDMVQKGAGWALRELLVRHPGEVVAYLERWPDAGRILVRYAMEKAAPEVRSRFIKQR